MTNASAQTAIKLPVRAVEMSGGSGFDITDDDERIICTTWGSREEAEEIAAVFAERPSLLAEVERLRAILDLADLIDHASAALSRGEG